MRDLLLAGQVIPACPLPLEADGTWSERHQRALVRYYVDAGAGGLAVGVHSTQFEIRDPAHGLFRPVLELAAETLTTSERSVLKIAGICGDTRQALEETTTALDLGYDAGLLSMTAVGHFPIPRILEHAAEIAKAMPIIGFYLQPSVGGRILPYAFWRAFCEIDNLVAIKIAPFNRYQTIDVVRAVLDSDRRDVALYTGNDDNIIVDLLTPFPNPNGDVRFIVGGLLGQWGVWTKRAVELLEEIKAARAAGARLDATWLSRNVALTDANAAIFDPQHGFSGCIPGIMEVLRRLGLSPSNRCLDPNARLSLGQAEALDRVMAAYPELLDDAFVHENLERWLS